MTTTTPTLAQLAGDAYGYFETAHRDDGESYTRTRDDAPEWVREIVYAAHGGGDFLPDDYRYEWTQEALEAIHDAGSDDPDEIRDDMPHEFADSVDVYNVALLKWLASNFRRPGYCDDAAEEGLIGPDDTLMKRITVGQYMERQETFSLVVDALIERAEAIA